MRAVPTIAAIILAVAGGAYFGLWSCGGYVWHREAFYGALGVVALGALALPWAKSHPLLSRVSLLGSVVIGYFVTQAVSAQFYPSAPDSWSMFLSGFIRTLASGPC